MTIAEALDRIRAAGVVLRVDGLALKASGVPLNERQRAFLKANKVAIISEIEMPSRCACGGPVACYDEHDGRLLPLCEAHTPPDFWRTRWPENETAQEPLA